MIRYRPNVYGLIWAITWLEPLLDKKKHKYRDILTTTVYRATLKNNCSKIIVKSRNARGHDPISDNALSDNSIP